MTTARKNRIITVQSRVVSRDTFGGENVSWVDFATLWADVQTRGAAMERFVQGSARERASRVAVMRVNFRDDIHETMRVVYENMAWDIEGIAEIGYHDDLDLFCETDPSAPAVTLVPITIRGGLSADEVPQASEITIDHAGGAIDYGPFDNMHVLIWRLASEDDIDTVVFESDPTRLNQIGAFTKYGSTVTVEGAAGNVWVSNNLLSFTEEHNVLEVA